MRILPEFESEARALAREVTLMFDLTYKLTEEPREDLVRLIAEALQSAYEQNS